MYVVKDGMLPVQALQISMEQLRELMEKDTFVCAVDVSSAGSTRWASFSLQFGQAISCPNKSYLDVCVQHAAELSGDRLALCGIPLFHGRYLMVYITLSCQKPARRAPDCMKSICLSQECAT